jgi:hypothetical protein
MITLKNKERGQIAQGELIRLVHPYTVLISEEKYSLSSNDQAAAVWVRTSDDTTESIASARGKALFREERLLPLLGDMSEEEIIETMREIWDGWQTDALVSEMIEIIRRRRDLLNPSSSGFSAPRVIIAADVRKGKVSRTQSTQIFCGIPSAPRLPQNQEKAVRVVLLSLLRDQHFHGAVELKFDREEEEASFHLISAKVSRYPAGGVIRLA